MEERLYEAALRNDTATLSQLPQEDPTLLGRANLDCEDENAPHAAATLGNEAFVQAILRANSYSTCYHMCLATDRDGRNPVHLAAMYGQLNILKLLMQHDRRLIEAALEKADRGGTILHLCVKHNQFEALKLLLEIFSNPEFVCTKNDDGMTVLHLVLEQGKLRPFEFVRVQGNRKKLNRLLKPTDAVCRQILQSLAEARALTGYEAMSSREMHAKRVLWQETRRDSVMVVAALIATMAFQAMLSPPGSVWQEDSLLGPNPHKAGEAVLAKTNPKHFRILVRANTVAFVASFGIIVAQIRGLNITIGRWWFALLSYGMWLSTAAIGITFAISFATVAPESEQGRLSTTRRIVIIIILIWVYYCLAVTTREIYRMVTRRSPSFQVDPDTSEEIAYTSPMRYYSFSDSAREIYQVVTRRTGRSPSLQVDSDKFAKPVIVSGVKDSDGLANP